MQDKHNELPKIVMTHEQLNSQILVNTMQRLNAAAVDGLTAMRIRKIWKQLKPALLKMQNDYVKEIQTPHQERLKEAGLDVTKPRPNEKDVSPELIAKLKELDTVFEMELSRFGTLEVEFDFLPLAPQQIAKLDISAEEIEALGPIFDEEGKVRQKYFEQNLSVVPEVPSA